MAILPASSTKILPAWGLEGPRVALVGATGLVGRTLLGVLEERSFPLSGILLLASERSRGKRLRFRGREVEVGSASASALEGSDLVFLAAGARVSRELSSAAAGAGATVVDKSSAWRAEEAVPLVVPEINGHLLDARPAIVSCPNCTTIGLVLALEPLRRLAGLRRVVVTTLQAVSGAGRSGLAALDRPDGPGVETAPFVAPITANVVAWCGALDERGESEEERKVAAETRRILAQPDLPVAATCVRVPVRVGHAASVFVRTERPVERAALLAAWRSFPGVEVADEPAGDPLPTPRAVEGSDAVRVGRVRVDGGGRAIRFFQVADNLRRGAATNAVQIAERLSRVPASASPRP